MSEIKITDLVPQETITKVQELNTEIKSLLSSYTKTATELAKGVEINVKMVGDVDKLEKLLVEKSKEAAATTQKLNGVIADQGQVIANTTNTISRQLMEQEKVNKTQREAYTEHDKVKKLLDHFHDTYEQQARSLVKINTELAENKKAQKDNEKELAAGRMSMERFTTKQAELIAQSRALSQEKKTLTSIMTSEEKATQAGGGSYVQMSQQLELLKKAYKDLSEEGRNSDFGKELEASIQNLDAHLKDMGADMGEFQRNVGNYAIAGQQMSLVIQDNVVSMESLNAIMGLHAVTIQDCIEQNKALEAAKMNLDPTDKNYASTLDSLNAKIAENSARITDVDAIMQTQCTTAAQAEAQNKQLAEALKHIDVTGKGAEAKIEAISKKMEENNSIMDKAKSSTQKKAEEDKRLADEEKKLKKELEETEKELKKQKEESEGLADSLLSLVGINTNLGSSLQSISNNSSANFIDGLDTKVKAFGNTLMGLLSNPWVLTFLGITGVVAGIKWWYDYNKGLVEATKITKDFTGLAGDELKNVRNEVQALADMYDKDFRETMEGANAMAKQFGISFQDALKLIEDGFVAGADVNGEFLENIKEYPAYFREAGISASQFIAITTQANKAGIYSDKGIDVIKEGNLRIREMTKSTASALDAIGISSKEVQKSLADGSKTTFDIMQEVSAKLAEFPEASTEVGAALADIFGGPGEDAGLQYILTLKDIDLNLDNVKERAGKLGQLQEEQLQSQVELENAIASVFDMTGGSFEEMTTRAKIFVNKGLVAIIKGCVDVVNWFVRMYNKSVAVRGAVNSIVNAFKLVWEVAKFVVKQLIDSFESVGTVIEGIVTLDWDMIVKGCREGMNSLRGNVDSMIRNIASNTAKAFRDTMNDQMKEVHLDLKMDYTGGGDNIPTPKGRDGYKVPTDDKKDKKSKQAKDKAAEKAAKEAEKAAHEQLKILAQLEEQKVQLMLDGYDKQVALIKLKYKKRIDAIKGESENEKQLRLAIVAEMERELADYEAKYVAELAEGNLQTALKLAEKGSKEELAARLAIIERQKQAELEANQKKLEAAQAMSDKTEEDKNRKLEAVAAAEQAELAIISEYDKKKLEEREKFEEERQQLIEKNYAIAQENRDNDMMSELLALQQNYQEQLKLAGKNEEKRQELQEKYEADSADITEKYAIKTAQASVDMYEEILKSDSLSAEDREKIERQLIEAKMAMEKAVADHAIAQNGRVVTADMAAAEKRLEKWRKAFDTINQLLTEANNVSQAVFDNQISRIEEEQDKDEEAKQSESERIQKLVDQKIITEEEGEARKRALEEESAKKAEELEKKKAAIKRKQAIFDKALAIANIGMNTAMALMELWVKPAWPMAIPMQAVVAALGAMQMATVLATPIPKYAKGTDYHSGGPAIVGDGGRPEVVLFDSKAWVTPAKPTLVDIPTGAAVIPDIRTFDDNIGGLIQTPYVLNERPMPKPYDDTAIRRGLSELAYLIRTQTKRQHADAYLAKYEIYKSKI
ncbi:MAG: hypothetical protein J6C59_09410 [Muribaculaceae bacterium]|nr:hypothetical protein [Muribaculaceae bacterium]